MNIVYGITDTGDQFSSGRKIKKIGNSENYAQLVKKYLYHETMK